MDKYMDKYIGKRLDGRYEIEKVIGIGGMAVVYKAKDLSKGNDVAIKILKEEYLSNEEFCRRFKNESQAIAMLNHKNIVRIYDMNNTGNLQYIVMEYIDGITLKDYIEQQGALSSKESIHFTTQILQALQHAHEKGIIHRDIKPQNIMLKNNGDIKVMDFGIARLSRSETRTMTDKAIGSVHYIAPEQAKGSQTDARADIYSVGVMLYEMLTGQLPFEADNAVSVAVMQLQVDPKMPRSINPDIPEGLEEITIQAMQKDPNNRYQTAAAMLMDLEDFKKNPSIRFEYQYMVDNSQQRYRQAYDNVKRQMEENQKEEKSPVIPVLAGIAVAFVLVAAIFLWVALDINDFFADKKEQLELPNFENQVYMEVIELPDYKDKLQFVLQYDFSDEVEEGRVISQNPKPMTNVYIYQQVTLVVSQGPERLIVPDFEGMTVDAYTSELANSNLNYNLFKVYSEEYDEDVVITTYPAPRTTMKEGDTVDVYYSIGTKPATLVMPNCANMTYTEAKNYLTSMGMTVAEALEVDSEKPVGTVVRQEPAYGTQLEAGQTVIFYTSNGKAPKKEVKVAVSLPKNVDQVLPMAIYLDGEKVKSVSVNPVATDAYSITLTGSGTANLTVYINDEKYRDYKVDFEGGTYTVTRDYGFTPPTTEATTEATKPTTEATEPPAPSEPPEDTPEPADEGGDGSEE